MILLLVSVLISGYVLFFRKSNVNYTRLENTIIGAIDNIEQFLAIYGLKNIEEFKEQMSESNFSRSLMRLNDLLSESNMNTELILINGGFGVGKTSLFNIAISVNRTLENRLIYMSSSYYGSVDQFINDSWLAIINKFNLSLYDRFRLKNINNDLLINLTGKHNLLSSLSDFFNLGFPSFVSSRYVEIINDVIASTKNDYQIIVFDDLARLNDDEIFKVLKFINILNKITLLKVVIIANTNELSKRLEAEHKNYLEKYIYPTAKNIITIIPPYVELRNYVHRYIAGKLVSQRDLEFNILFYAAISLWLNQFLTEGNNAFKYELRNDFYAQFNHKKVSWVSKLKGKYNLEISNNIFNRNPDAYPNFIKMLDITSDERYSKLLEDISGNETEYFSNVIIPTFDYLLTNKWNSFSFSFRDLNRYLNLFLELINNQPEVSTDVIDPDLEFFLLLIHRASHQ